ncbi:MAG: DUF1998 domain-containing protein, partial [Thiohalocapsa sp.]
VGLSGPIFDAAAQLVQDAIALVRECACIAGCPACIGPVLAADEQRPLTPKQAALTVLALLTRGARKDQSASGPSADSGAISVAVPV